MAVSRSYVCKYFLFKRSLSVQSLHRNHFAVLIAVIHTRLGPRSLTNYVVTAGRIMATNWKIMRRRRRLGKNSMAHSSRSFPVSMPTLVFACTCSMHIRWRSYVYHGFVSVDVWRSCGLFYQWHISCFIPHDEKALGATLSGTVAFSHSETGGRVVNFYDHRYRSRFHVWNSPVFLLSSTPVLRVSVVFDHIKPACLRRQRCC